jgi:hypothetical protein
MTHPRETTMKIGHDTPARGVAPWRALAALLLAALAPSAFATDHPLEIGGTTIIVPTEDEYLAVSPRSPQLHAFAQAAVPPELRVVEIFHTAENLEAVQRGDNADGYYLTVQVLRQIETMQLSVADWNAMLPGITQGMANADLAETDATRSARDARMSAAAGRDVAIRFGDLQAPEIYATTPESVRFVMRIPMVVNTENGPQELVAGAAGAVVLVKNKAVFVYWYAMPATSESVAEAQRKLDTMIAAMVAKNASDAAVESSPGLQDVVVAPEPADAPRVHRGLALAALGLAVAIGGALLMVIGFLLRKRKNP